MAAVVLIGSVFVSCRAVEDVPTPTLSGQRYSSIEELNPTTDLEPAARITSAGTPRTMEIETDHEGSEFVVTLKQHGEMYDEEIYKTSDSAFSLFGAAGEHYNLPIPLLKFPMTVGEEWEWSGSAEAAGKAVEATAVVTTSEEQVYVCGVALQAVKSNVKLQLGGSNPTLREMTFYFSPKRGLFKREYGTISIREPNCP